MSQEKVFGSLLFLLGVACTCAARELLIDGFESADGWRTGGQKEIRFDLSGLHVKQGGKALHLHVEIDHKNAEEVGKVKYPMGWPKVSRQYPKPIDLSSYDFLEFDVYFHSRDGVDPDVAMHAAFMDSDGREFYRKNLVNLRHGKWAHEKLCIRALPGAADFRALRFTISESMYDDGSVIDFYIDNLRATKAVGYEPPPMRPVRRPLVQTDAALLWFEGPCRKVQRAEKPQFTAAPNPVVRMAAARNETEAVQLVLRPLATKGVGRVTVEVGDLVGPGAAKIARRNITWSPVAYVPAREGPPEGLPDALPGPKPFTADEPWQYPIWLEVYVPPDTPAGDYAAPVTVRTGRGALRAELRLHVWDFAIPLEQHLRTSTYIYPPSGWCGEMRHWLGDMDYAGFLHEWRPAVLKLLARYRLSPAGLYNLTMRYDKREKKVVLTNTGEFERAVKLYTSWGLRFNKMPAPYLFDRPSFLGAKKGTPEYLERITEAFRTAAVYLDEKGWLDQSYVYCVDEVVLHKHTVDRDLALLNRVFDAIHAAHPKIRIFGAEPPSPVLRGMNIWCINMNCFDPDVLREQHALGNEVWWYNGFHSPRPGTRIAARGVDHRALFWMNWKYGIDGYLIWTVNRWDTNPWKKPNRNRRATAGQHFLLYPTPEGGVVPSIRLAMMRDGLEDYEYHWLLADLAKKLHAAGKIGAAAECERTLQKADAFLLAPDNCAYIHPDYLYESRRQLAEAIEKARQRLGE